MQSFFSESFKLGILGGGERCKMLISEAQKWSVFTCVLDKSAQSPGAGICNEFYQGDIMDYNTVYNFGKKVTILSLETENVNIEALIQLQREGIHCYPSAQTIQILQDKKEQKEVYNKHKIPTVKYQFFNSKEALPAKKFDFPVVWKPAKTGYDGINYKIIKDKNDLINLPDIACLIEEFITVTDAFSILIARDKSGKTKMYPIVQNIYDKETHQIEQVICPAHITSELSDSIENIALKVSEIFQLTGELVLDFFIDNNKKVFLNKASLAPHLNANYSMEATSTNQYLQQLRIIFGLNPGNTACKTPAVTVNLTGEEGFIGKTIYHNIGNMLNESGVYLHLYGKKLTYPNRIMGHVTVINPDVNKAKKLAERIKNNIRISGAQQLACN